MRDFALSAVLCFLCVSAIVPAGALPARAQDEDAGLVFLELFTAEPCVFCPAAERNFSDILSGDRVIGISCVVDYFDSGNPSPLSRPFCREQQRLYARAMKTGSIYTPQLVVNGRHQVPGHDLQGVTNTIRRARQDAPPLNLSIESGTEPGTYDVVLPALRRTDADDAEKFALRVLSVRQSPDMLPDMAGGSPRRERSPAHVAVALTEGGLWDGRRTVWTMSLPSGDAGRDTSDAFVVIVQDRRTAAVLAAGWYGLSEDRREKTP